MSPFIISLNIVQYFLKLVISWNMEQDIKMFLDWS